MSATLIGVVGIGVLMTLIFIRVPIGLAMLVCGIVGTWIVRDSSRPILASFKSLPFDTFSNYSLSLVPLFLLMGQFAVKSGMSTDLFRAAQAFIGHRRGGLAMSTVAACAGFGSISGSSLATAATMGEVALPEMARAGYSSALSAGTIAAGGTLGILIPPSLVLVIYAGLAEQNVAKLFAAALVPGVLAAVGYAVVIALWSRRNPESAPRSPRLRWRARLAVVVPVSPVLLIFGVVVGGIYVGWFSPTEGAAVGAFGTGALAIARRSMDWRSFLDLLKETSLTTGMIFLIILGAASFNTFLAFAQVPQALSDLVLDSGASPWSVLALLLLVYFVLGWVMESLSMILLTVPVFFPVIMGLDFGLSPEETAIWFGIIVLVVVEVGLITPPVGLNLFIVNAMSARASLKETYRGVLPFVASDIIRTAALVAFPGISLFLVRALF